VTFNVWTFLFEVLNFLVLAFVLHRLLYRPMREAIDRRKAETDRARTDAEAARADADAVKRQLAATLAETDRQRLDVLRKAADQAESEKTKRLAAAEAAAQVHREQALHDAEQLRRDTIVALEGDVGLMAVGLAERILIQACNSALNVQLAHHLAETIRAVAGEDRARVRRDAGTGDAVFETASPLEESTRDDLAAAIRDLVGHECGVKVEVKPALVGGALVRVGGHVWDATIAAQLEAAKAAAGGGRG
jgi:F-type H+-transporting ATPase subunit b